MNYIVLDLEWNQSLVKELEDRMMPFEIIEIGAVKLDSSRKEISRFSKRIKPVRYSEMHHKTKEIVHIDINELQSCPDFPNVAAQFFDWCGKDYIFCIWGTADLTELQRNMVFHKLDYITKPVLYYDIQKIFALAFEGKKNVHSLEYAVDFLNIKKEESFHSALSDAAYTMEVFQKIDIGIAEKNISIDSYHNPKTKKEEIHFIYDKYSKDISREFVSKESAMENKEIRLTKCFKCGKAANKKIRWFSVNSKSYYCLAYCKEHGYLRGKIRMKKTFDDHYYVIKTIKLINETEAELIRYKKTEIRIKKRKKLIRKKES